MIYGYLRVSTDDQDANSQKQGVDAFARAKGWEIGEYIRDEGVSGGKDPSKRNLGPLLAKLNKGDILIASEISRLGRDLLMVMDILKHCMDVGAVIHTVKDNYTLGDDVQSKVLAFAFGLSAEIERSMIRMRTKEGLMARVKQGVLLGRPPSSKTVPTKLPGMDVVDEIRKQYELGVPMRRIAKNLGVNRETALIRLFQTTPDILKESERKAAQNYVARHEKSSKLFKELRWKDDPLEIVELDREKAKRLIEAELTLPEIAKRFPEYTYSQVYDTVFADKELHLMYRKIVQPKIKRPR